MRRLSDINSGAATSIDEVGGSSSSSCIGRQVVWDWDGTLFPSTWINCQVVVLELPIAKLDTSSAAL